MKNEKNIYHFETYIGDIYKIFENRSLEEVVNFLKEKSEDFINGKFFVQGDEYHGFDIYITSKRLETDEEYEERIKKENIEKENRRKRYEQLKKEFEND